MSTLPLMWSVVCDDVRKEAGNKLSHMGIYSGSIVVAQFPARLLKLCFIMNLRVDADAPLQKAIFRVLKDDSAIAHAEVSHDQLAEMQARMSNAMKEKPELDNPHFTFTMVCEIAPFEITEPCTLKMRAETEYGEVRGGTIPVVQGSVPT